MVKKRVIVFSAIVFGLFLLCSKVHLKDGTTVLLSCVLLTAIPAFYNRKDSNLTQCTSFFFAALLNLTSAYGIAYSICREVDILPWHGADSLFRAIVMDAALLLAMSIVMFLLYSNRFPNDSVRDILKDGKKSTPMTAYLVLFSLGNMTIVFMTNPTLAAITLSSGQSMRIYTSLLIVELIILAGGYKLYKSESQSENLKVALTRETAYRKNQSSEDIATYCIDVDNDRFLEGGEYFTDLFAEGSAISYSEAFQITNQRFVHPEDVSKLDPYLKQETILSHMENTYIREENIRISQNAFGKYTPNDDEKRQEQAIDIMHKLKDHSSDDNEWIWVCARYSLTEDKSSGKHYLYISIRNINDRKKEELLLKENAERDALTGLYNRAYFNKHMEELLAGDISCGCVYMIDADHLKQVNDTLGHAEGDRMLINVASILKKEFRSEDIVARLGGDEFVVFAPGLQNVREIRNRAEKINQSGRREYRTADGKAIYTSLSIGISFYPLHGETIDELMSNADEALYTVKAATRDAYRIFG